MPLMALAMVGAGRGFGVDSFTVHENFLAQTNGQAIELTNALPQVQQLWEMPKIGAYLNRFASVTQQMGHVLHD